MRKTLRGFIPAMALALCLPVLVFAQKEPPKKKKKFIKRPATERLILIVDGTWGQSDLDELARAGWDAIFYPDEMEKLTAAIV